MILAESREVKLDANGRGVLTFQPARYGEEWVITRMTTYGNASQEPLVRVYRGAESSTGLVDTSNSGNGDVSDTAELPLFAGETLTVVYEDGSAGATMSFRVEGELNRRGIS
jgi:hypothetical protein